MYISISVKDGRAYATASKSVRKGSKVGKSDSKYLGRVIDREKGIYKNKECGLFMYDEQTDTFCPVPADYQEPKLKRKKKYADRPENIVSSGDIYLLLQFLVQSGFMFAIDAIEYKPIRRICVCKSEIKEVINPLLHSAFISPKTVTFLIYGSFRSVETIEKYAVSLIINDNSNTAER